MLIRDPVHGDIYLTRREAAILDTREVQRLRGIKQTGAANLVYPGCVHTRFDHSLGVCYMAKRIIKNLRQRGHEIAADEAAVVTAAALAHDVGHIPFGHTLEDENGLFPRHDKLERLQAFLQSGELAETLARQDIYRQVRALLCGEEQPDVKPWMREIIASTVDADMLDYLRRDSCFSGIRQQYDDRVIGYFTLSDDHLVVDMMKHGVERSDARSEILNLLRMRFFLTERVYLHHTKVIAGAMVAKAVAGALDGAMVKEDLYDLSDEGLLGRLVADENSVARRLAAGVQRRRLLKRAYVLASPQISVSLRNRLVAEYAGPRNRQRRESFEGELASELGLRDGEVILHCPEEAPFKEVKVLVTRPAGVRPLDACDDLLGSEVTGLAQRYTDLWQFFVLVPDADRLPALEACEAYFDYPSTYRPQVV